jgi:hypothetical protein
VTKAPQKSELSVTLGQVDEERVRSIGSILSDYGTHPGSASRFSSKHEIWTKKTPEWELRYGEFPVGRSK